MRTESQLGLCLSLILALASQVAAHGGSYNGPPADNSGAGAVAGGAVTIPGMPAMGGGGGGGKAPGATGAGASGARAATRGGSGRGSSGAGPGSASTAPAFESWEFWWEANRDRYLALKHRLFRNTQPEGSAARLTGRGDGRRGAHAERPSPSVVGERIVPVLLDVAASEDQRDILDSTVLALGRSVPEDQADTVYTTAVELLRHPELTVQGAAALALGVLDADRGGEVLMHLLADDSQGRLAAGGGAVPDLVRSFAALALGMLGDARSVHALMSTVHDLPDSERDVKSCVIAGLGLVPPDVPAAGVVESCLLQLLDDDDVDPLVRSYIPTSLGKIGGVESLPLLLELFRSPRTNILVRQSTSIALGQLGSLADPLVVQALIDDIKQGGDQQTRHFAFMALAQIAARDGGETAAAHGPIRRLLAREIRGKGKSGGHRSWAAMAAAVYGLGDQSAALALLPELRAAFERERDPSFRGAFAIALGLLDDGGSADAIHAAFSESRQQDFQGYASVALGLLRYRPASSELLELCRDKTVPPTFRLKTATSLGLMGDRAAVPVLVDNLVHSRTLGGLASSARALGLIGDESALDPLLDLAADDGATAAARAFACVALGLIGERDDLPFNAALRSHNNYRAQTPAIAEVLRIL